VKRCKRQAGFVAFASLCAVPAAAAQPAGSTALVGAKIFPAPTEAPIENGVVVIEAGKIIAVGPRRSTAIPRGARVTDVRGLSLTAGFWNSHVHFTEQKWADAGEIPAAELSQQLEAMLTRWGFVHVFDTGSPVENTVAIRRRVASNEVLGPAILTTGMILFPKGGSPPAGLLRALGAMNAPMPEVATAPQAVAQANREFDAGADGVKLYAVTWFGEPTALAADLMQDVAREAHRRGKLAFAHPTNRLGLERSIAAGVDVIVHTTPESGPWSAELIDAMKRARIGVIPTLKLWQWETRHARRSRVEPFIEAGIAQLRAYATAGGTVLFGTDVGYMDDYDPTAEYELMARAGLAFSQILASLTTTPAARFGMENHTGRVARGMDADLVVLARDPTANPSALSSVRYAFRKGNMVYRAP